MKKIAFVFGLFVGGNSSHEIGGFASRMRILGFEYECEYQGQLAISQNISCDREQNLNAHF